MRLLIKQYVNSLRERGELDVILPDVLSELGYKVIGRPKQGAVEKGVDVAAIGPDGDSIYLLSIKSGNLTRSEWDGGRNQALRPSLVQILETYIPKRIPARYRGLKVYIVLCFGGDIHTNAREDVDSFTDKYTEPGRIEFKEWNGDVITDLIITGLLREKIFSSELQADFRKALAFVDEPDVCVDHFKRFVRKASQKKIERKKDRLTLLRQVYLASWNVYVWCREEGNLDAAYVCLEFATLWSWELCREHCSTASAASKALLVACDRQSALYRLVGFEYIDKHATPYADVRDGLAASVPSGSGLDVSLKVFEVLGRIAMHGLWLMWFRDHTTSLGWEKSEIDTLDEDIGSVAETLWALIENNQVAFSPIRDDHAIEIMLVGLFLLFCSKTEELSHWVDQITHSSVFNHRRGQNYPCVYREYHELASHPSNIADYKLDATDASVLYPTLAIWLALLGNKESLDILNWFQEDLMQHSNWQLWAPGEDSEELIYSGHGEHGITLSGFDVSRNRNEVLTQVRNFVKDCGEFYKLSAVQRNLWPIILMACRHYRRPVPFHFLYLKNPLSSE